MKSNGNEPDSRCADPLWPDPLWRLLFSIPGMTGLLITLIGLALLLPGIQLITLNGSWYYAIAGDALIINGLLIMARRREALWLYGLILLGTIAWAWQEVGLNGWKLLPRLFAPAILGIWIYLPWVAGHLIFPDGSRRSSWPAALFGAGGCALLAAAVIVLGYQTARQEFHRYGAVPDATSSTVSDPFVPDGQWRYYGRTADGKRFSPLLQITPENVNRLEVAWVFRTGDMPLKADTEHGKEFNYEVTPIKIGNSLYICTPHRHVFSLNATTGKKNWEFDPRNDISANSLKACRGVAYFAGEAGIDCRRRIITTTGDARMVALDADTGEICSGFGNQGFVNLTERMGIVPPGFYFITSPPLVVKQHIILGGWIYDKEAEGEPSGVVRAYDPVTGALIWAWDLGRPNPTAPLGPDEQYTRSTPNAWGAYTADPKLGMVYLPLGNAVPRYFGGERRPFDDEYSSSVVALDIETGQERWHFQTVHHDLWGFDLPIGPSLVDIHTSQGIIPALVQPTRRGEFFLLDRRDGRPLTEIMEKPVPQHAVKGDYAAVTQPYPVGPPSLAPKELREVDTWGLTPVDQLLCRIDFKQRHYKDQFAPPALGNYLAYHGLNGVVDWYGASIDPARKLLIVNASYMPMAMTYKTQEEASKERNTASSEGIGQIFPYIVNGSKYQTPYATVIKPWLNVTGVPCAAPPWGTLTAIDLTTLKTVWQRPLGTTAHSGPKHFPIPALPTGIFNKGGNIITASGLIFIAATADNHFRAFDEMTGEQLWQVHLPAGGNATPATYTGGDGRQYVVIAAGGHSALKTPPGDYIIAYALPKT